MKLVPNAARIAWRAYSMWGQYLALLTLFVPAVLYFGFGIDTNPYLAANLAVAFGAFGIFGRVLDQGIESGHRPRRALLVGLVLAVAAIMLLGGMSRSASEPAPPDATGSVSVAEFSQVAVPLVAKWEGKRNTAYLDRIARPPVWTVCYGETRGVKQGDRYSDAQCLDMLKRGLLEYRDGLHGYFTDTAKDRFLTPERDAAYVSLAWNVGVSGAGKSTATRRLNAGDIAGGCHAITWWNKAGGRFVRGLGLRRNEEYELCMIGVA